MQTQRNLLEPGWGYFQIIRIDTLTKEGTPLTSKKGSPMIKINFQMTDCRGETDYVTDWITSEMDWKISNMEQAFGLVAASLYDKQTGKFNIDILRNKCGSCTLQTQSNDQYGDSTRIKMYVALDFMKMVNREDKVNPQVEVPEASAHPASVWTKEDMDIPF